MDLRTGRTRTSSENKVVRYRVQCVSGCHTPGVGSEREIGDGIGSGLNKLSHLVRVRSLLVVVTHRQESTNCVKVGK